MTSFIHRVCIRCCWLSLIGLAVSSSTVRADSCGITPGPDVVVGDLAYHPGGETEVVNFTSAGGIEAFGVATYSCNVGTVWLNWLQSPNINHPVIGQNLFRLKRDAAGYNRYEQVGQSWLKHGFYALSLTLCCGSCSSTDGTHLGVGCSDPYNATRNSAQSSLGPKWQVNATTGVHIHPVASPSWSGTVARRLQVKTSDLEVSDGTQPITSQPRYYVEGQYIAQDDAASGNKNNNASYRPMTVSGGGSAWNFARTGSTQREQAGIRAWKDFDPTVMETDIVTPEDAGYTGLVILAAQATDLGGGIYHYEYAVQNLNSDRSISSFTIPVSSYATISNVGFHDVDYRDGDGSGNITTDGTDWPATVAGGSIFWTYVNVSPADDNAIRWGTMYNFRFDCDLPPSTGTAKLSEYKAAASVFGLTVAPAAVICTSGDLNGDGAVNGLDIQRFTDRLIGGGATAVEKCAGDLEVVKDFVIDADDLDPFTDCVLNNGC